MDDLLSLVPPGERGDPMSPLRWTRKSLPRLAAELGGRPPVSHTVAGEPLEQRNLSLQADRKPREGDDHRDGDVQFENVNRYVSDALAARQPVISVNAKNNELVGEFKKGAVSGGRKANPKRPGCMTS